ncbi:MAG TPA: transglutaminase-like domain-containing protein [Clostridia bacterium]|jgi:hypothetical protein|nr:transglutaminase-like domain-containing protein [Clostridia bacterium]HQC67940.1 transglutaminase-like domain-containing protein [Clostridia bacterium]
MNNDYQIYTGALRVFRDFTYNSCNTGSCTFSYDFNAPEYEKLKVKYRIEEVAGNGSELEKALNLLKWCSANILHNGGIKNVDFIPKASGEILDYAFGKGREYGVYCRLQAIVFTECCLALGIKSRILHCLPFSPNDFDSHVVSIVYISDQAKWILLDAANNRYFVDSSNNILSPMEIRTKLAFDKEIECNEQDDNYKTYMAKNMFYFKSLQINTYGSDMKKNQNTIYCIPAGFNVLDREIAYCQYAIKNSPEEFTKDWKAALSEYQGRSCCMCLSSDLFFS